MGADVNELYPIKSVEVRFTGEQVNGEQLIVDETLQFTDTEDIYNYIGQLYDSSMSDPHTMLKQGKAYFLFTVEWETGEVKRNLVEINIVDDVFRSYDYHRSN